VGRAVAVVPESVRARIHSGLVFRPLPDAPPATIVVVWPQHSRSRQVAAFVRAAHHSRRLPPGPRRESGADVMRVASWSPWSPDWAAYTG